MHTIKLGEESDDAVNCKVGDIPISPPYGNSDSMKEVAGWVVGVQLLT